jgi:hypothetical protein
MLDGVSFTDPLPILDELRTRPIPVYNLSATPYPWNLFGTMDSALARLPGDEFHGAQTALRPALGRDDRRQSAGPVRRLPAHRLLAASNVEGSRFSPPGWINDMFTGPTTSGLLRRARSTIKIPTASGPPSAWSSRSRDSITSPGVTACFFGLLGHINFARRRQESPARSETRAPSSLPAIAGQP